MKSPDLQSTTDIVDTKSQEIRAEDGEVYTKMEDLADELPESSPRFILLSYPLTLACILDLEFSSDVLSMPVLTGHRAPVVFPSHTSSSTTFLKTATPPSE